MTTGNTIKGTARTGHTTPQGVYLERGYIYLAPDDWKTLYAVSKASGISASQYIASLITTPTECGTATKGFENDKRTQ